MNAWIRGAISAVNLANGDLGGDSHRRRPASIARQITVLPETEAYMKGQVPEIADDRDAMGQTVARCHHRRWKQRDGASHGTAARRSKPVPHSPGARPHDHRCYRDEPS